MSDEFLAGHFFLSLALGYGVAWFFTHLGDMWQRYGAILASFFIMITFIVLSLSATAVVAMSTNLAMTGAYVLGFVVGFIKR